MARPAFLFHNIYEAPGAIVTAYSELTTPPGPDASEPGFPIKSALDWRQGQPYRWRSLLETAQSPMYIRVDLGASAAAHDLSPNSAVIGGHNLFDCLISGAWTIQRYTGTDPDMEADHDTNWVNVGDAALRGVDFHDNLPIAIDWSNIGPFSHRWWRIRLTGTNLKNCQIGILTMGQKFEIPGGANEALDPYSLSAIVDENRAVDGSPLGVNVRGLKRRFNVRYSEGDAPHTSTFFKPALGNRFDEREPRTNLDQVSFVEHAIREAKPFWFNWNTDELVGDYWLCTTRSTRTPHSHSTVRRDLNLALAGWREVS